MRKSRRPRLEQLADLGERQGVAAREGLLLVTGQADVLEDRDHQHGVEPAPRQRVADQALVMEHGSGRDLARAVARIETVQLAVRLLDDPQIGGLAAPHVQDPAGLGNLLAAHQGISMTRSVGMVG